MQVEKNRRIFRSEGKMVKMILVAILPLLLTACGLKFEEKNTLLERLFKPEELLIGKDIFPADWYSFDPILPVGDDLVTHESVCQGYGKTVNSVQVGSAAHCVYRQRSEKIANRTFEHVYLRKKQHKIPLDDWDYDSVSAQQTFFGCSEAPDGSGYLVCEWGAQYEEYIITFQMRLVPGEATVEDMENIVRAIDLKVSEYLNLHIDSTE